MNIFCAYNVLINKDLAFLGKYFNKIGKKVCGFWGGQRRTGM